VRDRLQAAGHGKVELIAGRGGIFEIRIAAQVLFSKARTHRFPNDSDLDGVLQALS